jgi:ubiquinone/menaquinone biosynthesis C-methylase UbiE
MLKEYESHESITSLPSSTSYSCKSKDRAQEVLHLLSGRVVLQGKTILDLGCGPDPLLQSFQRMVFRMVGLDKEKRYVKQARKSPFLELILGDGTALPFKDASFTFVLCNDVLEHVRDGVAFMKELLRILGHNSAAYIQCANKYQIIEPHFLLPFLSWIPRPLANIYIRTARRGKSYDQYYPRTRRQLSSLIGKYRTADLTYERTLMKIETLNIQSKSLLRIVLFLRRVLSDRIIAILAQNFSIISMIVFKD